MEWFHFGCTMSLFSPELSCTYFVDSIVVRFWCFGRRFGRAVVLSCWFPPVGVCCLCGLPFFCCIAVVVLRFVVDVVRFWCFWKFCWQGCHVLMFGFLLWKFVVFVVCGLPSFVYSCLPSVCWCGCVASSGLVVGFLGLRSLLRWNLVTVRVFPLSFRVSEQFDTSQEVHAAAVSYSTHETICVTCLHIAVPESHISFQEQDWGPLPVRLWDVCCHHDQSDTL